MNMSRDGLSKIPVGAECLGVVGGWLEADKLFISFFLLPWCPNSSVREVGTAIDIAGTGIKSSLKVLKTFFITFSNIYCCASWLLRADSQTAVAGHVRNEKWQGRRTWIFGVVLEPPVIGPEPALESLPMERHTDPGCEAGLVTFRFWLQYSVDVRRLTTITPNIFGI